MSIVARVILALNSLIELVQLLLVNFGPKFVAFFFEALEKPWLVKS